MAWNGECCRTGFQWNGTPVGYEGVLADNKAYITGTNKKTAILSATSLPTSRICEQDFEAPLGFPIAGPNMRLTALYNFGGEVLPEADVDTTILNPAKKLIDIPAFFERHSKAMRQPEIFACARALRDQYGQVGAIDYCFGGWACFRLGAKGVDLVDCISVAHPSLLEYAEIDALNVLTQIIAPENDYLLTPVLKDYCNKVIPSLGVPYQYDYYPDMAHGFAVKGNPEDVNHKRALERAKNSAVQWLKEYLDVGRKPH